MHPVSPLGLPPRRPNGVASGLDPEAASKYEAVRLFVERAQAVRPDFALTTQNADAVAELCRQLDGIPLAIELAAARVRVLSPDQILGRLDQRFRLLTSGSRNAPERQQTLEAAIGWSFELLPEPERAVFRRLAAFRGGWSLEAAEAVTSGSGVEPWAVLDLLGALVDKSLVVADTDGTETRYRFLESLRQYARDRLVASGEDIAARDGHLEYFLAWIATARAGMSSPDVGRQVDREHENLRGAMEHAVGAGRVEKALRLAAELWRPLYLRGNMSEGRVLVEMALGAPGTQDFPAALGPAQSGLGVLCNHQGDFAAARHVLGRALAAYRASGSLKQVASMLTNLGIAAWGMGDLATADDELTESLDIFRALADVSRSATCITNLALVAMTRADYERAQALIDQDLATARQRGDRRKLGLSLVNAGELAWRRGRLDLARQLLDEGLVIQQEFGDRTSLVATLYSQGRVALIEGLQSEAIALLGASVRLAQEVGDKQGAVQTLEAIAMALAHSGDLERSVRLLGAADGLRARHDIRLTPADRPDVERVLAETRTLVDGRDFESAWEDGHGLTLDEAVKLALRR